MSRLVSARRTKPTCPICGHPLVNGECVKLRLHWTLCPTCRGMVDYGKTCSRCNAGGGQ